MLKYHITNSKEKVYTKYFDGAKVNEICHHILTTLHNDHPSRVIIHAGTNDVHENARATDVANRSIYIGVMCKLGIKFHYFPVLSSEWSKIWEITYNS